MSIPLHQNPETKGLADELLAGEWIGRRIIGRRIIGRRMGRQANGLANAWGPNTNFAGDSLLNMSSRSAELTERVAYASRALTGAERAWGIGGDFRRRFELKNWN
jgi:hypothetical protein